LAAAVESGVIQGLHIVDGGEIRWPKKMQSVRPIDLARLLVDGDLVADLERGRLRFAVQTHDALHDRRKRFRYLDVGGIGDEVLLLEHVRMHLRCEGLFDLTHRPTENDITAALRYFVNAETLTLQPLLYILRIFGSYAEAVSIFRGCKP